MDVQGLSEAGFSVTVLGHSLGAGAAALLTVILKDRCAAYPPAQWEVSRTALSFSFIKLHEFLVLTLN